MKYPGQPKSPPTWYRDRGQSYIENAFNEKLDDLANKIESEHWFGDSEKHGRYRVDFILKDARLIIELDGHQYHSTKEQLEKDAIRQRYLTRAGYTVIRFTGREINRSPEDCVAEVREIYNERIQRAPAKYRALYIDYQFYCREAGKALKFYRETHPDKELLMPSLDKFISFAIEWLHEKSFVTAFVFYSPEETQSIEKLNGLVREYEKGEVRINTVCGEWYTLELGEHMVAFSHLFDEFYLVADDPVYVLPLRSVLPQELSTRHIGSFKHKYLSNAKLLRKNNHETAFAGTDLAQVLWQNIWYPIGSAMGLSLHEL